MLQHRMTIGASESPMLFGFGSRLALFERKINGPPPKDEPVPEYMEWGLRHERAIRDKYRAMHPERLVGPGGDTVVHKSVGCMHATPDGRIKCPVKAKRGDGVLEIKTASTFTRDLWDDGVPMRYQIQVQHQLACTGLEWGAIAVLIGGNQYREGELERDDELIAEIELRCLDMDQRIKHLDPPPADGSDDCAQALMRMYPLASDEVVQLSGEAIEWTARLELLADIANDAEEERGALRNKIKAAIGDHKAGILPDGRAWKWINVHRKARKVKESKHRQLKLSKGA